MGRSGTLHAWEQESVTPDIQTLAKGLGGGYAPIAAMLINHRVADVLKDGTGYVDTSDRQAIVDMAASLTFYLGRFPMDIHIKATLFRVLRR